MHAEAFLAAPDSILAARIADGDTAAFEAVVRRYGPLMRAYAAKLMNSTVESDDVVQEAFITAWERAPDLEHGAALRSWLMRIVANKAIDRIRRRKVQAQLVDIDAPAPIADAPPVIAEVHQELDALASALGDLPDMQRTCWLLKEVTGASYRDIAAQLDVPESTVRGQLARARRTLIHEMEAWR